MLNTTLFLSLHSLCSLPPIPRISPMANEDPKSPSMSSGVRIGLIVFGVVFFGAIVLLLNQPAHSVLQSNSVARISKFPPWKHSIPLIGKHWVVEFEGCDGAILNNGKGLKRIITNGMICRDFEIMTFSDSFSTRILQFLLLAIYPAVLDANASMIALVYKEFEHLGVTVLGLLSESHIAIHTWPQYGYAATDCFTCGNIAQPQLAIAYMEKAFKANATSSRYCIFFIRILVFLRHLIDGL
jgi:S-adenosylmethionine decarboxylase